MAHTRRKMIREKLQSADTHISRALELCAEAIAISNGESPQVNEYLSVIMATLQGLSDHFKAFRDSI